MNLSDFCLLCLYSLGLRWLIFRYKKFAWFRTLLEAPNWALLNELLHCCYCQTIEASTVVYLSCWTAGMHLSPVQAVFGILSNGWIAIVTDALTEGAIDRMETVSESTSVETKTPSTKLVWGFSNIQAEDR